MQQTLEALSSALVGSTTAELCAVAVSRLDQAVHVRYLWQGPTDDSHRALVARCRTELHRRMPRSHGHDSVEQADPPCTLHPGEVWAHAQTGTIAVLPPLPVATDPEREVFVARRALVGRVTPAMALVTAAPGLQLRFWLREGATSADEWAAHSIVDALATALPGRALPTPRVESLAGGGARLVPDEVVLLAHADVTP